MQVGVFRWIRSEIDEPVTICQQLYDFADILPLPCRQDLQLVVDLLSIHIDPRPAFRNVLQKTAGQRNQCVVDRRFRGHVCVNL